MAHCKPGGIFFEHRSQNYCDNVVFFPSLIRGWQDFNKIGHKREKYKRVYKVCHKREGKHKKGKWESFEREKLFCGKLSKNLIHKKSIKNITIFPKIENCIDFTTHARLNLLTNSNFHTISGNGKEKGGGGGGRVDTKKGSDDL